jgi:hypothetical protein
MSQYTVRGSAELNTKIDTDLRRIAEAASPFCLAGVLLGGYGRGEGTPLINPDGSQSPFNDYDLVVVVEKLNGRVRQKFQALEKQLTADLGLPVDLYPYRKSDLPKCEFSLLNYEMKHGHQIVWGESGILDAMPDYPHDAIPLSEGSRLLMNRGKLLLDIQRSLADPRPLAEEERIRFIKFIHKALLAFGDCALLAEGKYDISYGTKKTRIQHVGECPDCDYVMDGYLRAIDLKEWGDFQGLKDFDVAAEFKIVRDVFLRFFPWYRAQYSARECPAWKGVALNLRWNGCPLLSHPRLRMYDALQELLKDEPDRILLGQILFCHDNFSEKFYTVHRRFS